MDWVHIGKRIRKHRELLGYTREVFAVKLDVTPKFCSDIELGLKGMSVQTLCRIADVLNLSTDYILFGDHHGCPTSPAYKLFQDCPMEKQPYLTEIIKAYLKAIE